MAVGDCQSTDGVQSMVREKDQAYLSAQGIHGEDGQILPRIPMCHLAPAEAVGHLDQDTGVIEDVAVQRESATLVPPREHVPAVRIGLPTATEGAAPGTAVD